MRGSALSVIISKIGIADGFNRNHANDQLVSGCAEFLALLHCTGRFNRADYPQISPVMQQTLLKILVWIEKGSRPTSICWRSSQENKLRTTADHLDRRKCSRVFEHAASTSEN